MVHMLGSLGLFSVVLIVAIIVLLFGSSSIPKLFRSVGRFGGEFRRGRDEDDSPGNR